MSGGFAEYRSRIIFFLLLGVAFAVFFIIRGDENIIRHRDNIVAVDILPVHAEGSFAYFLDMHENTPRGTTDRYVDIFNPSSGYGYSVLTAFEGEDRVLRTEERSYVQFAVDIPSAGLYNIVIEYFPVEARGIDIAREVRINGEVPFTGAELLTFNRVWGSRQTVTAPTPGYMEFIPATSVRPATFIRQDGIGNQIRPPQVEHARWERSYFNDRLGFFTEPYLFYFQAGTNYISLIGINEPLVLRSMTVSAVRTPPTHAEFINTTDLRPNTSDFMTRIEGEWSTVRSEPSLFPQFDSSSGATYPPSVAVITLNTIGGMPWRIPGQWIEWEVEVPEAGLYNLSFSARQNYNRGFVSSRQISINGVVPFAEVSAVPFRFQNSWELRTLSDDDGEYLMFPMNAGVNTIRMYVTLGDLGEIIDLILASVNRLNEIYREILVLTGPTPDPLRDYRIHHFLPNVMDAIYEETATLYGIFRMLEAFLGERNQYTGILTTLVTQLDLFHARPDRIPLQLVNFRQNISALADAVRALMESPLDIDFLVVSGTNAELPVVNETIFTRISHEARAFIASFTHDFDSVGEITEGGIEVWITTGRDQAQALKSMIDDTFSPETGISVNMRLVAHPAVLPAVVAGIGPDIVLSMPGQDPANFAFRNAAVDISQFPGFDEVYTRFHPSAWVPPRYIRGDADDPTATVGFYAVPETQSFAVMFYRTDILGEMGLDAPQTWDDVLAMMPLLQRNNMAVGVPPIGNPMMPDISGFLTQLYQRDGFIFNDALSRSILDTEEALDAFEAFTRFFTHFGSPQFFDPANRFRSGEMPIIFAPFELFNMLSVFAPEIYGLWNFGLMPGFDHHDYVYFEGRGYERIHHTISAFGTYAMMIEGTEHEDEAWQFLKWWTEADTQLRFGRELESIMGAAARFPTANLDAFSRLPWSAAQLELLTDQRNWILGTPEIPGGYYVMRHLVNAIRRVVNENVDTRETLLDFNIVINRELANKRREFGLE